MNMELWELENYVDQAMKDYEEMANEAEKNGKPSLANYYDGIRRGINEILNYVSWYEEQERA